MSVFPLGKFIKYFFYGMLYFNKNLFKQQKNKGLNITSFNLLDLRELVTSGM